MTTIAEWLASIGLAQYGPAFEQQEITPGVLPSLTDQDLKDLGVSLLGHRRKLMMAIGQLVSAQAEQIVEPKPAEARTASGAERRHLTVMFCDLVGSTAMAARLDPEDMREVVRSYQGACAQVIARYEGFVAQYLGDGIMAYFGYPAAHEDDAERAVRAGLDLIAAVTKVQIRVGIATGLVVVGDLIGEQGVKERAVTGETPNLAARLQGLAAAGSVVIAAATRRLLGAQFDLRDLGPQSLKGLDTPVQAFAVAGVRSFESRFEARAGGLTGFVGRDEECEHLNDRWKLARQGRGQVVVVSGEAGIGKSRLTAWLADKMAAEPHTRMRFQCTPHHKDSALYPTISQIERAAGLSQSDTSKTKIAKLEALVALAGTTTLEAVPLIAALLTIQTGDKYPPLNMSPGQQRQRTLAAMLDQIEGLARQKPLLMIYEDAHWADATSLELLDALVDRIARLPVLFVVTGRPEFQSAWAGRHNVSTVTLQKLDRRDARVMVESVAGAALPPEVLDQIVAKTDGVPLFVEELTKTVLESGALVEDGGTLSATTTLPIPATLQDSLMARLDRSNPVKAVAQIGAAIGREFSYKLLTAVAGMSKDSLREGLAKLEEAELASRRGALPDATYTFKHALIQDAAYESLLKSRRQVIHRRIAKALRDRFPVLAETEPEIIAHHFTQSGRTEQAVAWWTKAGALAAGRGAFAEAVSHYRRAITIADTQSIDNPERLRSHLQLQTAYREALIPIHGWSSPQTREAFARAAELANQIDDPDERFGGPYGDYIAAHLQGDTRRALRLAETFKDHFQDTDVDLYSMMIDGMLGCSRWQSGDFSGAIRPFEESISVYDPEKHSRFSTFLAVDPKVNSLFFYAETLWPLGRVDEARAAIDEAYAYACQTGDIASIICAKCLACIYEVKCNDLDRLKVRAETLIAASKDNDLTVYFTTGRIFLNSTCRDPDAIQDTIEQLKLDLAIIVDLRCTINEPITDALLADLVGINDPQSSLSILDERLAANTRTGNCRYDAELHRRRGRLLSRTAPDDPALAEAAFQDALEVAHRQRARTYTLRASLDLARLYCETGREGEAVPLLHNALIGFTPTTELPEIGEAQQLLLSLGGAVPATPVVAVQ